MVGAPGRMDLVMAGDVQRVPLPVPASVHHPVMVGKGEMHCRPPFRGGWVFETIGDDTFAVTPTRAGIARGEDIWPEGRKK